MQPATFPTRAAGGASLIPRSAGQSAGPSIRDRPGGTRPGASAGILSASKNHSGDTS